MLGPLRGLAVAAAALLTLPAAASAALTATAPAGDAALLTPTAAVPQGGTAFTVGGVKDAGQTQVEVRLRALDDTGTLAQNPGRLVRTYAVAAGATSYSIDVTYDDLGHARACLDDICRQLGTSDDPPWDWSFSVEVAYADGSQPARAPGRVAFSEFDDATDVTVGHAGVDRLGGATQLDAAGDAAFTLPDGTQADYPGGIAQLTAFTPLALDDAWVDTLGLAAVDAGDGPLGQLEGPGQGFASSHALLAGGVSTVAEHFALARSPDGASAAPTPLTLARAWRVAQAGNALDEVDTWTNGGTTAVTLKLAYDASNPYGDDANWGYSWNPGAPLATSPAGGRTVPPDAPAGGYLSTNNGTADAVTGWLAWQSAPQRVEFASSSATEDTVLIRYDLTIPAGGSTSLRFVVGGSDSPLDAQKDAANAIGVWTGPTISVKTPKDGAHVTTTRATLTGTVKDNRGVAGFTVAGKAVKLTTAGSFKAYATLARGANAIALVATDTDGNVTTTTLHVTRDPVRCVVPKLIGKTLKAARKALTAAGCRVGTVRSIVSTKRQKGRVVAQSIPVGWSRGAGSKVGLTIGKGGRR